MWQAGRPCSKTLNLHLCAGFGDGGSLRRKRLNAAVVVGILNLKNESQLPAQTNTYQTNVGIQLASSVQDGGK